jgi:hypothetical protein
VRSLVAESLAGLRKPLQAAQFNKELDVGCLSVGYLTDGKKMLSIDPDSIAKYPELRLHW